MNKKIILGICIVIIIAVGISLVVMFTKKDILPDEIENNNDESFYENGNIIAEDIEPINKDMELENILQDVKNDSINDLIMIDDTVANGLIELNEYEGLEKRVAKYEDEDEYTEIWLFKISKQEQDRELFRMFNSRIENLKSEYRDNEKISEILNNEKNIIMKQQNGIAIVIISNDATEIETAVDKEFLK